MNSTILMGRLTKDPEIRYTQSQMAVAIFTVAVNRPMTKEKKEEAEANNQPTADFVRCKAFGKAANTIERYVFKGNRILIRGHIQTGHYQNQQTGQTVYTTDVIVDQFDFVDYNNQQNQGYGESQGGYTQGYTQGYAQAQPQQQYHQPASQYQQPVPQYQQSAPAPQDQQMTMDDELPPGYQTIDEDDIPF